MLAETQGNIQLEDPFPKEIEPLLHAKILRFSCQQKKDSRVIRINRVMWSVISKKENPLTLKISKLEGTTKEPLSEKVKKLTL